MMHNTYIHTYDHTPKVGKCISVYKFQDTHTEFLGRGIITEIGSQKLPFCVNDRYYMVFDSGVYREYVIPLSNTHFWNFFMCKMIVIDATLAIPGTVITMPVMHHHTFGMLLPKHLNSTYENTEMELDSSD